MVAAAALALVGVAAPAQKPDVIDGLTFADERGKLYLPARKVAAALEWRLYYDRKSDALYLNQKKVGARVRRTADGTLLIPIEHLKARGLEVSWDAKRKLRKVRIKRRAFYAREGAKRVVIHKNRMQMRAWQGQQLVFSSPVSLGIEGHNTPSGIFEAQGYKAKMHRSTLYQNAPMPYAVHVVGDVFIHGWPDFASGRRSHGCIRLPMKKAQWFYFWVEKETPISILGKWPRGAKGA